MDRNKCKIEDIVNIQLLLLLNYNIMELYYLLLIINSALFKAFERLFN